MGRRGVLGRLVATAMVVAMTVGLVPVLPGSPAAAAGPWGEAPDLLVEPAERPSMPTPGGGTETAATDVEGAGDTFVVSRSVDGDPSTAPIDPRGISIAASGRYAAFAAPPGNLAPTAPADVLQVFLRDLEAGTSELISTEYEDSPPGTSDSWAPAVSGNGKRVAFLTQAYDLNYADDKNPHLVVHSVDEWGYRDLDTIDDEGEAGPPDISPDGRWVAFSHTSDLDQWGYGYDTNEVTDVYLLDLEDWDLHLVSVSDDAVLGNHVSDEPVVNDDGNVIAFTSGASNLVGTDDNDRFDVFVRDRAASTTQLVSVATDGSASAGTAHQPDISGDGTKVVFVSDGADLVEGDSNAVGDVFVRDLTAGTTRRLSVTAEGAEVDEASWAPSISTDGRIATFWTEGALVPTDTNGVADVYSVDLLSGTVERLSLTDEDTEASGPSSLSTVDHTGGQVAFLTQAPEISGDGGVPNVAVRRRPAVAPDPQAPTSTSPPVIYGTPRPGYSVWLGEMGTWTGYPESYDQRWERCDEAGANCTPIEGSDGRTYYYFTEDDLGATVRAVVSATNPTGTGEAPSDVIGPVTTGDTGGGGSGADAISENTAPPTITGTAEVGQYLYLSSYGTWTEPGTYSRQWIRCDAEGADCTDITDNVGYSYYYPDEGDIGSRFKVRVTVTNEFGATSAESALSEPVQAQPVPEATVPPSITGDPTVGSYLYASVGQWRGNPSFTYRWQLCDAEAAACESAGVTASRLELGPEASGRTVRVEVRAQNPVGVTTVVSDQTAVIGIGAPPANAAPPSLSGRAEAGRTLRASNGSWSGYVHHYLYRWERCVEDLSTCEVLRDDTNQLSLHHGDVGSRIRVSVAAVGGAGESEYVVAGTSDVVTLMQRPSHYVAPTLSTASPTVNQSLSLYAGVWNHEPETYRYRIQRCDGDGARCVDVSTNSWISLTAADEGLRYRGLVQAENMAGKSGWIATGLSGPVGSAVSPPPPPPTDPPVNTTPPSFSATPVVGTGIYVSPGTWDGATSYRYTWERCTTDLTTCVVRDGNTYRSYFTPSVDDAGSVLQVTVVASNAGGSAPPETTVSSVVELPPPPTSTRAPTVNGRTEVGQRLTISVGNWSNGVQSYSYAWERCDAADVCEALPETTSYRDLVEGDIGWRFRATVIASNYGGSSEPAVSDLTSEIVPRPPAPTVVTAPALESYSSYSDDRFAVGMRVRAVAGTWSPHADSYEYRIERCSEDLATCEVISGPSTYFSYLTVNQSHVGYRLRLGVRATNGGGTSEIAYSAPSPVVPPANVPTNVEPPAIQGATRVGSLLRVDEGHWSSGPGFRTYTYWQRCDGAGETCANFYPPSSDRSGYVLREIDVGATIRVEVRAYNDVGSSDPVLSATTAVVEPGDAPVSRQRPALRGDGLAGEVVAVEDGVWDPEVTGHVFSWEQCDADGAACSPIPGSDGRRALRLDPSLVGATVRAVVQARNSGGPSAPERSEPSVPIAGHTPTTGGDATRRISIDSFGRSNRVAATDPDLSGDGRIVAYVGAAGDVQGEPRHGPRSLDVLAHDTATGRTRIVSATPDGLGGNANSSDPVVAAEGRYVAFTSSASDLVPGDTDGSSDVFRADLDTGEVVIVSRHADGASLGGAHTPSISGDGKRISFQVGNSVFVKDLVTGEIRSIGGDRWVNNQAISDDGNTLVFTEKYSVFSGPCGWFSSRRLVVLELDTSTRYSPGKICSGTPVVSGDGSAVAWNDSGVMRVNIDRSSTVAMPNPPGASFSAPILTRDGLQVVFHTSGAFVPEDTDTTTDVYAHAVGTQDFEMVSVTSDGGEATGGAVSLGAVNDNGLVLAVVSNAPDLIAGAPSHTTDVVLRRRAEGGPSTVTLTSDLAISKYGQSVRLDATVAGDDGLVVPTGFVTFYSDGARLQTRRLVEGAAHLDVDSLSVGDHELTAVFGGDGRYFSATSDPVTLTVEQGDTTVSLSSTALSSRWSQPVPVTASVEPVLPAAGVPTGDVVLTVDGVEYARSALASGSHTFVIEDLEPGEHHAEVTYEGAPFWLASSSSVLVLDAVPAPTAAAVTAASPMILEGESVTFDLAVTAPLPATDVPTGDVTLRIGSTDVATVPLDANGEAQVPVDDLPVGDHLVRAVYGGSADGHFAPSTSAVRTQKVRRPIDALSVSAEPASGSVYGEAVTFTAITAWSGDGADPTGTVVLREAGVEIGRGSLDGLGHAVIVTDALDVGAHDLVAEYLGDGRWAPFTGEPFTHVVDQASSAVEITSLRNPIAVGDPPTYRVEVVPVAPGGGVPMGSVTVARDGVDLDTVPLVDGAAEVTDVGLAAGSYEITASYTGDERYLPSVTGSPLSQLVQPATVVTATGPSGPVEFGDDVTVDVTVAPVLGGDVVPTGSVSIRSGEVELATAVLVDGVAQVVLDALEVGEHALTVEYDGDGDWAPSIQDLAVTVVRRSLAVTLTAVDGATVSGQPARFDGSVLVDLGSLPEPTGFVSLWSNDAHLTTVPLGSDGTARLSTSTLAVGHHLVELRYGGDDNYGPSVSPAIGHDVARAGTAVSLGSVSGPVPEGDNSVLRAHVVTTPPGSGIPTGTVRLLEEGVEIATAELGTDGRATFEVQLALGTHTLVAAYDGDARSLPSTSDGTLQHVRERVTIEMRGPPEATVIGTPTTFEVTVTGADGTPVPTGRVALLEGETAFAVAELDEQGKAVLSTDRLPAGSRTLHAQYVGDDVHAPLAGPSVTHDVLPGTVSIALESLASTTGEGKDATFVATLTPSAPQAALPTGSVTFLVDGQPLANRAIGSSGQAVLTTSALALGDHVVTATWPGDANYGAAASGDLAHRVEAPLHVSIDVDETAGVVPFAPTLSALTTGPDPVSWEWQLGDGSTVTGPVALADYDAPGKYVVGITVRSEHQSAWATTRLTAIEDAPLEAVAGGDLVVVEGDRVRFDGSSSRPAFGIEQYLWDFGDGGNATGAVVTHRFDAVGSFTAELEVHRVDGGTDTQAFTVKVIERPSNPGLHVTVRESGGALLNGATVVVIDQIDGRYEATTGADGTATILGLADHTYSVYAIAPGHRPETVSATVVDGEGSVTITLEPGDIGVAELETKRMTPQEIADAGIDLDDPENNIVYEFEIWLNFTWDEPRPVRAYVHEDRFLSSSSGTNSCSGDVCDVELGGGARASARVVTVEGQPVLQWIVIPGRAQYLKEFWEVTMIVTNLSGEAFAFTDGEATLRLPSGLSLANTATPQTLTRQMDDIPGGETRTAVWYVRGDVEGNYTLAADYSGVLYPIGTPVNLTATAREPITVWGRNALEMIVDADDTAHVHDPYQVRVGLKNVSDGPVYNATFDFFQDGKIGFIYQPRQPLHFVKDVLAPGETFWTDLVLVPQGNGELNLERSFVRFTGGDVDIPDSIVSHPEIPIGERPRVRPGSPFHKIWIDWDPVPDAVAYRIFVTANDHTDFPYGFVRQVGTTDTVTEDDGDPFHRQEFSIEEISEGFFAVQTVFADGHTEMVHNATYARAGRETSAQVRVMVECGADGSVLDLEASDSYFDLAEYRVLGYDAAVAEAAGDDFTLDDLETVASGPLSGRSASETVDLAGLDFGTEDPPVGRVLLVQVRNTADQSAAGAQWTDPVVVNVFETCERTVRVSPSQTFGTDCQGQEYLGNAGVEGHNPTACRVDPVNTATGSLVSAASDARFPGAGITFDFERTYNSADEHVGPLGRGWTHAYDVSLTPDSSGAVLYKAADGQRIGFLPVGRYDYQASAGSHSTLRREPLGGWTLIRRDQVRFHFDDDGRLVRMRDRNGMGVVLTHGADGLASVIDQAGRIVTFTHTDGRLTNVALPDGRSVSLAYTGGMLTSVSDLAGGVTQYRYDAAGRLEEEIDPRGNRVHLTTYGDDGRVVHQEDGLGAVSTFTWDAATQTSVLTDARGGTWTDVYDENVLVSSTDPLGNTNSYVYDDHLNLVAATDARGKTTTQFHDARGNVVRKIGPAPSSYEERFTYDDLNNRTSHTDARGVTTQYGYDSIGRLTSIAGPGNRSRSFDWDERGHVEGITDALGHTEELLWDDDGNLAASISPLGNRTEYDHDDAGRLVAVIGPRGFTDGADPADHTVRFSYDALDRRTAEIDPRGGQTSYVFDANGNTTSITDASGRVVTRGYDAANQQVSESVDGRTPSTWTYDSSGHTTSITSPLGHAVNHVYDAAGRRIATVLPRGNLEGDPDGFRWQWSHDAAGNVVSTIDPLGNETTVAYDELGRAISSTDAAGGVTSFVHDQVGNVVSVTDAAGATSRALFDAAGLLVTEIDPLGNKINHAYDAEGRRLSTTTPTGSVARWTYDPEGRLTESVEPRGNAEGAVSDSFRTRYVHDAAGNVISVIDALGAVSTAEYDAANNVVAATDAAGRTTTTTLDPLHRPIAVQGADGATTTYGYSTAGELVERIDPNGHRTTWTHDIEGRQLTRTDPLGNVWSQSYDAHDQVVSATQPSGIVTTLERDRLDRVSAIAHSDGTPGVTYAYDVLGRRTQMVGEAGTRTYQYDAVGRVISTSRGADTFEYDYDLAGRLASRVYPDGTRVDQTHDADGRLSEVTSPAGTFGYAYDPASQVTAATLPNGLADRYDWDALGRLSASETAPGAAGEQEAVRTMDRVLDAVGNPVVETTDWWANGLTYDEQHRLTGRCDGMPCAAGETPGSGYGYDPAGNRTTELVDGAPATSYAHDAGDRITSVTDGDATTAYEWDANGRLVRDGTHAYDYDANGRLRSVDTYVATSHDVRFVLDVSAPLNLVSGTVRVIDADQGINATLNANTLTINGSRAQIGVSGSVGGASVQGTVIVTDGAPDRVEATLTGAVELQVDAGATAGNVTVERTALLGLPLTQTVRGDVTAPRVGEQVETLVTYAYDGDGQRTARTDAGGTTEYVWDPLSDELVLERDGSGRVVKRYTHGLGPVAVEAIAEDGSTTDAAFIHRDAIGSVVALSDESGAVVEQRRFDPFGVRIEQQLAGDVLDVPLGYAGSLTDPVTGLVWMQARDYAPWSGRFLAPDPLEHPVGAPFVSTYAYAANRPGVFVDPEGLRPRKPGLLDQIQTAADWLGVIPVIGEPIDAVNGLIYLGRGQHMNAALSLAGIIPIVGDSLKVFRYADEAADAAGMLRRAPDVYGSVRRVDNSAWAARGTVRYGDDVAPAARRADCNSFVPGTRVVLADGSTVPIEDVEVGDEVLGTSDGAGERGDSGSYEVTATISSVGVKDLVEVTLADGSSITATSGHPVWVADGSGEGAWVDAADVRAGDALVDTDGTELVVTSVSHRGERTEVHNLTVEDVHTYYALAGDTPVWVHNSVCDLADDGGDPRRVERHAGSSGGSKPIIIGENMDRVAAYAERVGGHAYSPWDLDPWDFDIAMRRNERWIKDMRSQGREIIDIGPDFARRAERQAVGRQAVSPFYEMERRILDGYANRQPVFARRGSVGGVPGLDAGA